jgi:hypothetical protein
LEDSGWPLKVAEDYTGFQGLPLPGKLPSLGFLFHGQPNPIERGRLQCRVCASKTHKDVEGMKTTSIAWVVAGVDDAGRARFRSRIKEDPMQLSTCVVLDK